MYLELCHECASSCVRMYLQSCVMNVLTELSRMYLQSCHECAYRVVMNVLRVVS